MRLSEVSYIAANKIIPSLTEKFPGVKITMLPEDPFQDEPDSDYVSCKIGVEYGHLEEVKDYFLATEKWDIIANRIEFKQTAPEKIPAKVGNFVLIYSDFKASDEECSVGLVTSSHLIDGVVGYGCSHLQLEKSFSSDSYSSGKVILTDETYGGYQSGFLKILTKEEVIDHLKKRCVKKYEETLQTVMKRHQSMMEKIPKAIEEIVTAGKPEEIDVYSFHEDYLHHIEGVMTNKKSLQK